MLFHQSCLVGPSQYASDCMHCWLCILLKCETPPDIETLQEAPLRICFSILDKESKLTDPWRRVILRKVRKSTWEVLDELGQSVLDTVPSSGDKGVLDQWGTWYKHPSVMDYKKAMLADEQRKSNMDEKEADAVSSTLLSLLVLWAVEEGKYLCVFCLCVWHLTPNGSFFQCQWSLLPQHEPLLFIKSARKMGGEW